MIYRILGRTGLSVSAIGLGCEGFMGKTEAETRELMDFSIEQGVNVMDVYSSNPELRSNLGKALEGRRQSFVLQGHICSTWENGQYLRTRDLKKTITAFEEQLRLFRTDYLDIGMIHYVDDEADFHTVFDGPIMQQALQWKKEGRIRHIGMSSHNPHVAIMAVKTGLLDVLMFSINPCYDMQPGSENIDALWADESYAHALHNIDSEREYLYELCDRMEVGIDVMKVYAGGDLLNTANSPFGKSFTPVQCIEYVLTRPGVASALIGCRSRDELLQAVAWCNANKEEKDYASVMQNMDKFTWRGHCMYCGHCAPCSVGIDIASVNPLAELKS